MQEDRSLYAVIVGTAINIAVILIASDLLVAQLAALGSLVAAYFAHVIVAQSNAQGLSLTRGDRRTCRALSGACIGLSCGSVMILLFDSILKG